MLVAETLNILSVLIARLCQPAKERLPALRVELKAAVSSPIVIQR